MDRSKAADFPLFANLTEQEQGLIQSLWKERHYQKGQSLFLKDHPCSHCFFIRSGSVKLTLLSSTGKEQIIDTLGPGDTCSCHPPEMNGCDGGSLCCSAHGEALTDCHVFAISNDSFARLFATIPSLPGRLCSHLAHKVRSCTALIEDISLRPSFERVAHFLLNNPVKFSQEELARRLGVARETASRHLNKIKRMNLIDIKPQEIVVLDRKGLEELVNGNNYVEAAG